MRIKKLNTLFAVAVIGAGSLLWMGGSTLLHLAAMPLDVGVQTTSAVTDMAGAVVDAVSTEWEAPSNAVEVPWRNYNGKIPGKVTLKKWTVDDRTYYQMAGPINRQMIGNTWDNSAWGSQPAYEVFFSGSGDRYEQWLINPSESTILHYDSENHRIGESELPASRFHTEVDGDRITVTFWSHNRDTPSNLVFNYNGGSGGNDYGGRMLSWTSSGEVSGEWNHHKADLWRYP